KIIKTYHCKKENLNNLELVESSLLQSIKVYGLLGIISDEELISNIFIQCEQIFTELVSIISTRENNNLLRDLFKQSYMFTTMIISKYKSIDKSSDGIIPKYLKSLFECCKVIYLIIVQFN